MGGITDIRMMLFLLVLSYVLVTTTNWQTEQCETSNLQYMERTFMGQSDQGKEGCCDMVCLIKLGLCGVLGAVLICMPIIYMSVIRRQRAGYCFLRMSRSNEPGDSGVKLSELDDVSITEIPEIGSPEKEPPGSASVSSSTGNPCQLDPLDAQLAANEEIIKRKTIELQESRQRRMKQEAEINDLSGQVNELKKSFDEYQTKCSETGFSNLPFLDHAFKRNGYTNSVDLEAHKERS